jgi:hypothetical protein
LTHCEERFSEQLASHKPSTATIEALATNR